MLAVFFWFSEYIYIYIYTCLFNYIGKQPKLEMLFRFCKFQKIIFFFKFFHIEDVVLCVSSVKKFRAKTFFSVLCILQSYIN